MSLNASSMEEVIIETMLNYGYPLALAKACHDSYCYRALLKDNSIIEFNSAEATSKEWVHIPSFKLIEGSRNIVDSSFERGVDIRVDFIVAVSDYGS